MENALTIDVEDYFMVSAFTDTVRFEDWPGFEGRVAMSTGKMLEVLGEHGIKATFFVLGWVGERYPELVREISSSGHEVASHSYNHRLVYDLTPGEFREDVKRSKLILEDITGKRVVGYRAPSYSIVEKTPWALDILIEEGFLYDSSVFPIHHDIYGQPNAERFPHVIRRDGGRLTEFPPSTYRVIGQNIPVAGGGYLRLFPLWFLRKAVREINVKEKQPAIFYIHSWEIDDSHPRLKTGPLSSFRHYYNLKSTLPKLKAFFKEFRFKPLSEFLVK